MGSARRARKLQGRYSPFHIRLAGASALVLPRAIIPATAVNEADRLREIVVLGIESFRYPWYRVGHSGNITRR